MTTPNVKDKLNKKTNSDVIALRKTRFQLFFKILIIILWITMMILIAWFSSQPANISTQQSNSVDVIICKIVIKDFKTFTEAVKQYYIDLADKFVRKAAHFTEYAVLGILSWAVLNFSLKDRLRKPDATGKSKFFKSFTTFLWFFLIPLFWCFLYSLTDEFHQRFVEGRYGSMLDSLIDTSGAAVGMLILLLIRLLVLTVIRLRRKKTDIAE